MAVWTAYEGDHVPLFNLEEYSYRIKPKPREFWIDLDPESKVPCWPVDEINPTNDEPQVIKVREV